MKAVPHAVCKIWYCIIEYCIICHRGSVADWKRGEDKLCEYLEDQCAQVENRLALKMLQFVKTYTTSCNMINECLLNNQQKLASETHCVR